MPETIAQMLEPKGNLERIIYDLADLVTALSLRIETLERTINERLPNPSQIQQSRRKS
jgi:hypothetical protein